MAKAPKPANCRPRRVASHVVRAKKRAGHSEAREGHDQRSRAQQRQEQLKGAGYRFHDQHSQSIQHCALEACVWQWPHQLRRVSCSSTVEQVELERRGHTPKTPKSEIETQNGRQSAPTQERVPLPTLKHADLHSRGAKNPPNL